MNRNRKGIHMDRFIRRIFGAAILFFAMLFVGTRLFAQEIEPVQNGGLSGGWASLGGGSTVLAWQSYYAGLTFTTKGDRVYSVRIAGATKDEPGVAPDRMVADFGVLYGMRRQLNRYFMATGALGLGVTASTTRGKFLDRGPDNIDNIESGPVNRYESVDKSTVGLLYEGEVLVTAIPVVTIGLNVFGNLNELNPYLAGGVVFHLGWIR
jgi:hypothetical protein